MRLVGDGLLTKRESAAWTAHAERVREDLRQMGCTCEGVASLLFVHRTDMRLDEFRQRMNAMVCAVPVPDSPPVSPMAKNSPPLSPMVSEDSRLSSRCTPPSSKDTASSDHSKTDGCLYTGR